MFHLNRRLALLAVGICALLAPATASAVSTLEQIATAKNSGVTYLKTLQLENGSIPGFGGDWSLTSFAAAGTAAVNIKKTGTSTDARTWYKGLVGATSWPEGASPPATEFERAALIAYAAGIDPARVSKTQNLIASIASYYQPASQGYYGEPGLFNGTVFGLLALADTKTRTGVQRVPQVLLEKSIAVVRANQHTDGGWTYAKAEGSEEVLHSASEPDMTGAAMAALCTAGVAKTEPVIVNAKNYLKSLLVNASGAFTSPFGVNTDSNAWAVQGLNACGIESQGTDFKTAMNKTPIDFLISQQLAGGAFRYPSSGTTAEEYSSQDAVRALAGGGFTATPPVPTGGLEQWVFESSFNTSPTVFGRLALIINNGTSTLKVCSVKIAPEATSTTLGKVLDAAVGGTTPTGCVTSRTPTTGEGAITSINGLPSPAEARWKISIDGGAEVEAKRNTPIHLGDTIYLKLT
jgi:hypothetical protein